MRAVARDVAAGAKPLRRAPVRLLGQGVPRDRVVVEHPVGVVERVEVVGVQRQQHAPAVGVIDRLAGEARVRVFDNDRADHLGTGVDRVQQRLTPLVAAPDGLRALFDRDDRAALADADPGVVVVSDAGEIGDQARGVAVGGVFGLRVVVVALRVPTTDVVGVTVAVVVEAAADGTLREFVSGEATVAEDRDQILRRQIRSRGAADVDLVDVLMFAAGDAAARRSLFGLRKWGGAGYARRVDARVLGIVADVEVAVVVEVVGAAVLSVCTLGVGKLPFVQVDVVQRILDPVVRVVDPAFDVGDADVGPAEVALGPGAGDVDPRRVVGITRVERPAGKAAVGVRPVRHRAARGKASVALQWPEQVPLLVVAAAGDGILRLARREPGIVGEVRRRYRRTAVDRRRRGGGPGRPEREHQACQSRSSRDRAIRPTPHSRLPSSVGPGERLTQASGAKADGGNRSGRTVARNRCGLQPCGSSPSARSTFVAHR